MKQNVQKYPYLLHVLASNSLKHLIINFASGYKIMEINILLPVTNYGRHAKNKWKNIAENETSY